MDSVENIDQNFTKAFGRISDGLEAKYNEIQSNLELTDEQRGEQALAAVDEANSTLLEAEIARINAYVDLQEDLTSQLFAADTALGLSGKEIVKEGVTETQLSVMRLTDDDLAKAAQRASGSSQNSLLAKCVAAEADARGMDDVASHALSAWEDKQAKYSALKSIPSGDVRAQRLKNIRERGMSLPTISRLRPTREQWEAGSRQEALGKATRRRIPE